MRFFVAQAGQVTRRPRVSRVTALITGIVRPHRPRYAADDLNGIPEADRITGQAREARQGDTATVRGSAGRSTGQSPWPSPCPNHTVRRSGWQEGSVAGVHGG